MGVGEGGVEPEVDRWMDWMATKIKHLLQLGREKNI